MIGLRRAGARVRKSAMIGGVVAAALAGACDAAATTPSEVPSAVGVAIGGRWTPELVGKLVEAVEGARDEGLDPEDYNLGELRRSAAGGTGPALDLLASASAMSLAHDYLFGRVADRSAMGWMIQRSPYEAAQLSERLDRALVDGNLKRFYASLLPSDFRYAALRDALPTASGAERDRLRANMERWRWMPRSLGADYLYVNVPSFRLQVFDEGTPVASYDVVVGAKDMPTPDLASPTSSLVVNPWWYVPASIVKRSGLRPGHAGYQFTRTGDGWAVKQPPGPRNSLGRIKFNLVNDQAIYLHDTPAKRAFDRDERALSHGCIRVKHIDQLAAQLMNAGGDDGALQDALAGARTATLTLPQTWQVYIVYFTVDADQSGSLVSYGDPYGYDGRIVAALDGAPLQVASR